MKPLSRSFSTCILFLIKEKYVKRPLVIALLTTVENANFLVTDATSLALKVSAVLHVIILNTVNSITPLVKNA